MKLIIAALAVAAIMGDGGRGVKTEPPLTDAEIVAEAGITQTDVDCLAYLVEKEAGGIPSEVEQAAVVWCVLNRVDDARFPATISGVLYQPGQFRDSYGTPKAEFVDLATTVLSAWVRGDTDGRLPAEFCWYSGDGRHNYFRDAYRGGTIWDWR